MRDSLAEALRDSTLPWPCISSSLPRRDSRYEIRVNRVPMPIRKLHFVYNVELNVSALVRDFVHRLTDPETYPCKLCDITYGRFMKKPTWQMFVWSLPVSSVFYTKDQFYAQHPKLRDTEFPAVFAETDSGELRVFLSSADLKRLDDLDDLEAAVRDGLTGQARQAS